MKLSDLYLLILSYEICHAVYTYMNNIILDYTMKKSKLSVQKEIDLEVCTNSGTILLDVRDVTRSEKFCLPEAPYLVFLLQLHL